MNELARIKSVLLCCGAMTTVPALASQRTIARAVLALTTASIAWSQPALADEPETPRQTTTSDRPSHLSVGYALSSLSNDFGMGARVTSPFVAWESIAFRVQGGIHWKEGFRPGTVQSTWEQYGDVRLGVLGVSGRVGDFARVYGEGGAVLLIPSAELDDGINFGGYGIFGFEFLGQSGSPVSYFFEAGGIGTGARASELLGNPLYANGFVMQAGIHWYPY